MMLRSLVALGLVVSVSVIGGRAEAADAALQKTLADVYGQWRNAIVRKDITRWQAVTAQHRQVAVRNRIFSERRAFPSAVFNVPFAPPSLARLRPLRVEAKGAAAKAVYFGKVDFGVAGEAPTENLLVLNFLNEGRGWKYDEAEFVNLSALAEVRKQLLAGDLSYVKTAEFGPSAKPKLDALQLRGPVKYISKVYVYSPGREVKVMVNKVSRHLFQNTKAAEVVIGGARDGRNEIEFGIKSLPGSTGKEPMEVRVYLMSEVQGVQPIKVYEYLVPEGGVVKPFGTQAFNVTPAEVQKLQGR